MQKERITFFPCREGGGGVGAYKDQMGGGKGNTENSRFFVGLVKINPNP